MKYKKYCVLISPAIVIIIMGIFYAVFDIFPFGEKTVAWCDLSQQTIPLLMNLKDVLDGKSHLFYTTAMGGGMNFWGVFLFFLSSPFYLLVKFIEKQNIIYFVNILLTLKLALCSLSASTYISLSFKKLKKQYVVLLGLIYAFCGYGLLYYQTLVWLDVMYLFPMLVLSVDRLMKKKKTLMYILTLSATVIVNYYLSFMTVIYLLISVPLYIKFRCRKSERKILCMKFILSSVCSALITAPVWLCSFIQVGKSARSMNNLAIMLYRSAFESLDDKLCIIITNAMLFVVLLLIIGSPLMKKPRIRYNFSLLIFLIIPVVIDLVNKMWHAGGYQSFPLRYGYMIVFTLIIIACEIFQNLPENNKTDKLIAMISFSALGSFILITWFVLANHKSVLEAYSNSLGISSDLFKVVFSIFILAFSVYLLCFTFYKKKLISNRIFMLLISCVFITEVFVNVSAYVGFASSKDRNFDYAMEIENKINDNGYYRVKNEKKYLHVNIIGGLGLDSYGHYTSLTPEDYMFAMKKLGYSSYWMEVGSNGGTAITDALLGIKYSIGSKYDFSPYYKIIYDDTILNIAENSICSSPAVISNAEPENSKALTSLDRFEVQKQIANQYFKTDDMLIKYGVSYVTDGIYDYSDGKHKIKSSEPDISKCKLTYNIKVEGQQTLYFDLFNTLSNHVNEPYNNSVRVVVNNVEVSGSYPTKSKNGLLKLGDFEDENVEVNIILLKDIEVHSFGVFGVDTKILSDAVSSLETTALNVDGNKLTAKCLAGKNEYLYLAVPWDSGFNAYLNGSKVPLYRVNDTFCAVRLSEGENNLKLVFYPEGFGTAIILTSTGLILSFIIIKNEKMWQNKIIGTISTALCKCGFIAVITIVYIAPVIIYIAGLINSFGA